MFKSQLDLGNVQRVRKLSLTLGSVQKLFEFRSLSVCCFLGWSSMLHGSLPKGGAGGPGASFPGESVAKVGSCRLYPPSSHAFLSPLPRIPFFMRLPASSLTSLLPSALRCVRTLPSLYSMFSRVRTFRVCYFKRFAQPFGSNGCGLCRRTILLSNPGLPRRTWTRPAKLF